MSWFGRRRRESISEGTVRSLLKLHEAAIEAGERFRGCQSRAEKAEAELALRRKTHEDVCRALGVDPCLDGGAEVAAVAERVRCERDEAQLVANNQAQRILELERALRAGNVPEILS